MQIDPFTLDQAKRYIDSRVPNTSIGQHNNYEQVRDEVLSKISGAFSPAKSKDKKDENVFLSFIGYPPVLDAIATLLCEEPNYYRIQQTLSGSAKADLETGLLVRISDHLLDREHQEKAPAKLH